MKNSGHVLTSPAPRINTTDERREEYLEILAVLRSIDARLSRIEAQGSIQQNSGVEVALAEAIQEAANDLPFTAADLLENAEIVFNETPKLRRVMEAALSQVNARVLGRWLADCEGRMLGLVRFVRSGERRGAVLWRCESENGLTRRPSNEDAP